MKRKIRLTESDLHRIVKESVGRILSEYDTFELSKARGWLEDAYNTEYPDDKEIRDYLRKKQEKEEFGSPNSHKMFKQYKKGVSAHKNRL